MRRQFVLVTAAVTTMVVVAFLIPLLLLIRTLAAERAMTNARQVAQSLAPVLATAPDDLDVAFTVAQAQLGPGMLGIYLPEGTKVGTAPEDDAVSRARDGEAFTRVTDAGRTLYIPVLVPDRGTAVVRAMVPRALLSAGVRTSWFVLCGVAVALILGAVVLADRLARAAITPVRDVADAARRLGRRDLGARAPVSGPTEIADMARALNGLAERITLLLAAERERVADLSHRLRTPLTALRLDVEALGSTSAAARLAADVDAVERAVDEAIVDARRPLGDDAPADAVRVVRERVAFWQPLAEDQGRRLELFIDARTDVPLAVPLPPTDLAAAVDALLDNVMTHTPEGTGCTLRLTDDDGRVALTIEDDGPGMPSNVLRRGASSAGSTGLGLDIARRTAESAGGGLEMAAGDRGARVTMVLLRAGGEWATDPTRRFG